MNQPQRTPPSRDAGKPATPSREAANQEKATDGGLRGTGGSPGFGANADADDPQAQQPQRPGGGGAPGTGQ